MPQQQWHRVALHGKINHPNNTVVKCIGTRISLWGRHLQLIQMIPLPTHYCACLRRFHTDASEHENQTQTPTSLHISLPPTNVIPQMPHPCAPTGAFSLGPRVDVNQTRLDQSIMRSDSLGFNLTNTLNTQIHSEGYDIFETARNIEACTEMGYGNSHQLRESTLLTATKKQHAQQSISIVTVALL